MEFVSALKPLRTVSQIMGLNVGGWLGKVYTSTVILIMSSLTYPSYVHLASKKNNVFTGVDSLILWTQLLCHVMFVLVVLGICVFRPRQFLFPIEEMRRIDIVLGFFGAKVNDRFLYRLQLVQILVSFVTVTLLTFRDILKLIRTNSIVILFHWLQYGHAVSMIIITDCLFVDYLAVINERFSKLNQLLKSMIVQNKHPTFNLPSFYVVERNDTRNQNWITASNVERLRILHHDLCFVAKKVNRAFGLQQLLSTTISLIMITGQLYEAYHFILMENNPVGIGFQKIMWILFYVCRLFHVSYMCNCTSSEASLTSSIINEMPVQQVSSGVSAQMQHFSLQLIQENLNFNACGFFDIDFTLIRSIIGVVSTYLVILIQMDRKIQCFE